MTFEYSKLPSISQEEFDYKMRNFDRSTAVKSDGKDISKIEQILELRDGILANQEFMVSKVNCKCGRELTFYDLIASSLKENHNSSFIVHTLLGSKHFVQHSRKVHCSVCGTVHPMEYSNSGYGCCDHQN